MSGGADADIAKLGVSGAVVGLVVGVHQNQIGEGAACQVEGGVGISLEVDAVGLPDGIGGGVCEIPENRRYIGHNLAAT